MTTDDRRAHRRFRVPRIPGVLAFSLQADVVNLSLAGMAVECPVPLAVGKRFAVRIGTGTEQLDLMATVRWCERISDPPPDARNRYRAGFAFHNILTEKAETLLSFLERNVVLALDRQMFGRLEVDGDARAHLEGDFELQIESLGLTGAEVETRQPPELGAEYELELNLDGRRFSTRGRVLEIRALAGEQTGYAVEVEFLDPREDQLEVLRAFLREHIIGD